MMVRGFGYLPDPPKGASEDWSARELLSARMSAPLPAAFSNRKLVPELLDQGKLGSCTANAVAYSLRAAMLKMGIPNPPFVSRLFLYYLARATHGDAGADTGTYLRAVFEVANKFGFCAESEWAYDDNGNGDSRAFKLPSHKAFRAAFDQHEPTEYRRIYETGYDRIEVIKRALSEQHLVVFGTDVSVKFAQNAVDPTKGLAPPVGEAVAGGHAMALAEYDGDSFRGPNSWGREFGDEGWFNFSADYLAWERTRDLWIVRYAPPIVEVFPDENAVTP